MLGIFLKHYNWHGGSEQEYPSHVSEGGDVLCKRPACSGLAPLWLKGYYFGYMDQGE